MTLYAYINDNFQRIKTEIRLGIIPCSILRHWQIYSRYDYHKKTGCTTTTAVVSTMIDLKVSDRYIYAIIKKMETEV